MASKYKPKQLHKHKTSAVNNVLLSLVVIENGVDRFIKFNEQSLQFKNQFDEYVNYVRSLV